MRLSQAGTAADYRELARRRLPRFLFDYVDGAANSELAAARNVRDLDAVLLRQRVMADVSSVSTELQLFGQTLSMPLLLGPVGLAGLLARRGEVQAAQAAANAGIPFCLSTFGLCAADEIRAAVVPPWFQLYMMRDRGFVSDLLAKLQALGSQVLILTVDTVVTGPRYRDRRSGLSPTVLMQQAMQVAARPDWMLDVYLRGRPLIFGTLAPALPRAKALSDFWAWVPQNLDPKLTWQDFAFARRHWHGPIMVKGILDPLDAQQAVAEGVDGIAVSNHGGRQLDAAPSTITALPRVAESVGGRVPVLVDGGIRSGIDILKARALGADACLMGRTWAYALAAGGRRGVAQLLADVHKELRIAMALAGCTDIRHAGADLLAC